MNQEIFKCEDTARWYRDNYHPGYSVNFVRRLYLCFLNIHFMRWTLGAKRAGVLRVQHLKARRRVRLIRLLERNPDCLGYIFAVLRDKYDLGWLENELNKLGVVPADLWTAERQAKARVELNAPSADLAEALEDPELKQLFTGS